MREESFAGETQLVGIKISVDINQRKFFHHGKEFIAVCGGFPMGPTFFVNSFQSNIPIAANSEISNVYICYQKVI